MKHQCGNCGKVFDDAQIVPLELVPDLGDRLDPGSEVPSGECKECGMLVYVIGENEVKLALIELRKAARAVCEPLFTASDGGAMWCSMREKPGAKKKVDRLMAALEKADALSR